jgi:hypothetical protein
VFLDPTLTLALPSPPLPVEITTLKGDLGLLSKEPTVRLCALSALDCVQDEEDLALIWFACSDAEDKNRRRTFCVFYESKDSYPGKNFFI